MYQIPRITLSVIRDGTLDSEARIIRTSADIYAALGSYMAARDREHFVVLILDPKHRIAGVHTVSVGTLTAAMVHPRETFKAAVAMNGAAIIAVHNHPTGDPTPSPEDRALTKRLKEAGEILGIPLLDHVVMGDGRYYSFADRGCL